MHLISGGEAVLKPNLKFLQALMFLCLLITKVFGIKFLLVELKKGMIPGITASLD